MNVLYCLRRARRCYGSRIASQFGELSITWDQFYDRVYRAAAFLRDLGIQKGDRIAIWMLNSHEYLELYYATAIAGIVIVPLNTRWNDADVRYALQDSGARAVVLDDHSASNVRSVVGTRLLIYAGKGSCPYGMVEYAYSLVHHTFEEPDPEDLVVLLYTSGTTGGPKGVMLTHFNLWSNVVHAAISAGTVHGMWLHAAPLFHIADQGAVYFVANAGGGNAFLPSFEPEAFLRAVEVHRITATALVPTMLVLLLNHPSFGKYDLSSLKTVLYGASPMPASLLEACLERMPSVKFRQEYGMTETSPLISVLSHMDHFGPASESAGKAALGVEVRIVDDLDSDVPTGETGEIIVRGANVMKGYWNKPEITAEVLRGGWMHTGDIGKFDRYGFLYVCDRKKDMIKTGGENVYSPDVESKIGSHPAVMQVAVIGVPDPQWGEALRAVVVLHDGSSLSEQELIAWCRERMTHFKCPSSVVFVGSLPIGATGKVQKNILREKFSD
jgi:long-chain acyl-CoA synthetase